MKTFALTGVTGHLGGDLLYEIIKNNINNIDDIKIFCFGRSSQSETFYERIKNNIKVQGWQYFSPEYSDDIIEKACSAIIPIEADLGEDILKIKEEDLSLLNKYKIDYFFHIAAITDFRDSPKTIERLKRINIDGTKRILQLIDSLPYKLTSLSFVSSSYACGTASGEISPDFLDFEQKFRNPYEKTKMESEHYCREFCKEKEIPLNVFRPSAIMGRTIEEPIGFVNKYDVFLAFLKFFMALKVHALPDCNNWEEIYASLVKTDIRICGNERAILNMVSQDFCAKVMYQVVINEYPEASYHLVNPENVIADFLFHYFINFLNVEGWTLVDEIPDNRINDYEEMYYKSVGNVFTPYGLYYGETKFDCSSMMSICDKFNIPTLDKIIEKNGFDILFEYSRNVNFGLDINKLRVMYGQNSSLPN